MYQTITKSMFHDAFRNSDRLDNFSYEAREWLYDYLIELEESCDKQIELDVIALCCEFSEEPLEEVLAHYELENVEALENNTLVICVKNGNVLYQVY